MWGIGWSLVFWLGVGLVIAKLCGAFPDTSWALITAPIWGPLLALGIALRCLLTLFKSMDEDDEDDQSEW